MVSWAWHVGVVYHVIHALAYNHLLDSESVGRAAAGLEVRGRATSHPSSEG